jgi:sugar phosphate isomerase/epimerase
MRLGFSTLGCPDWDLARVLDAAVELGFEGVEMRTGADAQVKPGTTDAEAERVGRDFRSRGVEIFSLMSYARFALADAAKRAENVEQALSTARTAAAMGARFVRVFGGRFPEGADPEAMIAAASEGVAELVERAKPLGVEVVVETHDDWCPSARLARLLEAAPGLGVVWDFANVLAQGADSLERSFDALAPRVGYCHVKDWVRRDDGSVRPVLPGEGEVDIARAVETLRRAGFAGYLSFEWEKRWHPDLAPPEEAFPAYLRRMGELTPLPEA